MLIEEARWLNRHLSQLSADDLYPMCNIGSATEHYRQVAQPYIDKYLFEPPRARNLRVIHVDAKTATGVDMVGDLTDASFVAHLADLNVRSVMCCNLLEHVTDRVKVRDAILSILEPGGYVIATVPFKFPYHEDPIDTMYRPTTKELFALFAGTSLHKAATIRCSRFVFDMQGNHRALCRLLARTSMPFYRPAGWKASVKRLCEIMTGYKVTCVILRKVEQDARQIR
jgi:hypothetical protein